MQLNRIKTEIQKHLYFFTIISKQNSNEALQVNRQPHRPLLKYV